MSGSDGAEPPLVVALRVRDPALAARAAARLAAVPGLRLAADGEPAELALIAETLPADRATGLTARELEVVELLSEGASNKEIARRLGISVHTAKFHVGQLLEKLDAVGRTDAVAEAARRGVIRL